MSGVPDKRLTSRLLPEVLRVFASSTFRHDIGKQFSFVAAGQPVPFRFQRQSCRTVREVVEVNSMRTSITRLAIVIFRVVIARAKDDCI